MLTKLFRSLGGDSARAPAPGSDAERRNLASVALEARWKSAEVSTALRWLAKDLQHRDDAQADPDQGIRYREQLALRLRRLCGVLHGHLAVMERQVIPALKRRGDVARALHQSIGEFERLVQSEIRPFVARYAGPRWTGEFAAQLPREVDGLARTWASLAALEKRVLLPALSPVVRSVA